MANDAQVSIQATILPDEIAKTLTGTMTVAPVDANDKWYYKLTACTTTSTDLIAGNYIDYTAVDDDTAPTAIASGDKVKFLFIQNTSSADGVVVCFDGGAAANDLVYSLGHHKLGLVDYQTQQLQIFTQLLQMKQTLVMQLQY